MAAQGTGRAPSQRAIIASTLAGVGKDEGSQLSQEVT